jgi:hypothetical protein
MHSPANLDDLSAADEDNDEHYEEERDGDLNPSNDIFQQV